MIDKSLSQIQGMQGGGIVPDPDQEFQERLDAAYRRRAQDREAERQALFERRRQEMEENDRSMRETVARMRRSQAVAKLVGGQSVLNEEGTGWRIISDDAWKDRRFRYRENARAREEQGRRANRDELTQHRRERLDSIRGAETHGIREFLMGKDRSQRIQEIEDQAYIEGDLHDDNRQQAIDQASDLTRSIFRAELGRLHKEDPALWPDPREAGLDGRSHIFSMRPDEFYVEGGDRRDAETNERLQDLLEQAEDEAYEIFGDRISKSRVGPIGQYLVESMGRVGELGSLVLRGDPDKESPLDRLRASGFGQWVGDRKDQGLEALGRGKDWALGLPGRGIESLGRGFAEAGDALAEGATHEPTWSRVPPPYGGDRNIKTPPWLEFKTGSTAPIPHANRAARALGYNQNVRTPQGRRRYGSR